MEVVVNPTSCIIDEILHIKGSNLTAYALVTFYATMADDDGCVWHSRAYYIADVHGEVDVITAPSVGGSYTGVQPMGLVWSMAIKGDPDPEKHGFRFVKKDVTQPLDLVISIHSGHVNFSDIASAYERDGEEIASCKCKRYYMATGVSRQEVNDGRLRGAFYMPNGEGPFPGILDFFGSSGGLMEHRSALLASRGFTVLSLAFFNYKDLPSWGDIDLEYFEEGVDWLCARPGVFSERGIGVISVSKGSDIALLLPSHVPKVTAVVAINGFDHNTEVEIKYKGEIHKSFPVQKYREKILTIDEIIRSNDICDFHFEKSTQARFLLLAGAFDRWANPIASQRMLTRFESSDEKELRRCELVVYPGAGHLLEPPFAPFCRYVSGVDFGGERKLHSKAQEQSWAKIRYFFTECLHY
ncbi:bile acid-CoA:amino acid N-acyltransferase-like [Tubulanus polymorphus]|uniref:bile acid-CoA:amino acid N-acyltransferase-like n=1 Tax=Tubulanus polymorphus TaxID=672921 RepID=UPI003DA27F7D